MTQEQQFSNLTQEQFNDCCIHLNDLVTTISTIFEPDETVLFFKTFSEKVKENPLSFKTLFEKDLQKLKNQS